MASVPRFTTQLTGDSTVTIYSEECREAMHSSAGAYRESVVKHVRASGILDTRCDRISILDVGFGIGYNILAALAETAKARPGVFISVVSLEKNRDCLPLMENLGFGDERDAIYGTVKEAFRKGSWRSEQYEITVLFGDARDTIRSIESAAYDAVFHDPFSHLKNPELWSLEFFREERRLMSGTGVLTTYSAAPQVRSALLDAGFIIGRGPVFGNKRGATMASRSPAIPSLSRAEIVELRKNPQSLPYRDPELKDSRETILRRWNEELESRGCRPARRE